MEMMAATTAGAVGLSLMDKLNAIIIPFFGVPLTVVTMAAAGAAVSFIHGDREPDTKKVFKQVFANSFISLLLVVVVPKMFHMAWVEPGITPAIAALVAWISRWGIPALIKLTPDIVRRTFKLGEYNDRNSFGEWGSGFDSNSDDSAKRERYYNEDTKE